MSGVRPEKIGLRHQAKRPGGGVSPRVEVPSGFSLLPSPGQLCLGRNPKRMGSLGERERTTTGVKRVVKKLLGTPNTPSTVNAGSGQDRAYERHERTAGKLARSVLGGLGSSNAPWLLDTLGIGLAKTVFHLSNSTFSVQRGFSKLFFQRSLLIGDFQFIIK